MRCGRSPDGDFVFWYETPGFYQKTRLTRNEAMRLLDSLCIYEQETAPPIEEPTLITGESPCVSSMP